MSIPLATRFPEAPIVTVVPLLGYAAATCTTVAFVPQVLHIWRTRQTRDISLGMFVVMTAGVFMWLVYGLTIRDRPLVVANGVTFVLSLTILVMKLRGSTRP
jgi:MtN3 and saliva related transmembrane protein